MIGALWKKQLILATALAAVLISIIYLESLKPERTSKIQTIKPSGEERKVIADQKAKEFERAKEIISPSGFINSEPFELINLIGKKVILVDFWTYSCINCQRTTPYLNAWYEKYKDKGLEIVGIHTPEFDFEKKYENVLSAVKKFNIKYPVVQDNEYATWTAYGNRYWPRKYLIDIDGFVVYDHIGEGGYEETEKKIQELLEERMEALAMKNGEEIPRDTVRPEISTDTDFSKPRSPEIYFGASRNSALGNGIKSRTGLQNLKVPQEIAQDTLNLDGEWNFTQEHSENKSAGAKIIFKFTGKNVYFVARSNHGVRIKILIDRKTPGEAKGEDINPEGFLTIKEDRLYNLIRGKDYGEHTLEIIIESPGLQAFTFTFG